MRCIEEVQRDDGGIGLGEHVACSVRTEPRADGESKLSHSMECGGSPPLSTGTDDHELILSCSWSGVPFPDVAANARSGFPCENPRCQAIQSNRWVLSAAWERWRRSAGERRWCRTCLRAEHDIRVGKSEDQDKLIPQWQGRVASVIDREPTWQVVPLEPPAFLLNDSQRPSVVMARIEIAGLSWLLFMAQGCSSAYLIERISVLPAEHPFVQALAEAEHSVQFFSRVDDSNTLLFETRWKQIRLIDEVAEGDNEPFDATLPLTIGLMADLVPTSVRLQHWREGLGRALYEAWLAAAETTEAIHVERPRLTAVGSFWNGAALEQLRDRYFGDRLEWQLDPDGQVASIRLAQPVTADFLPENF